jgi:hypothetical protein
MSVSARDTGRRVAAYVSSRVNASARTSTDCTVCFGCVIGLVSQLKGTIEWI